MYQRDPNRPKVAGGPLDVDPLQQRYAAPQVSPVAPQPSTIDTLSNMAVNVAGNKAINKGVEAGTEYGKEMLAPLMNPAATGMAQAVAPGAATGAGSQAAMLAAQNAGLGMEGAALTAEALGAGTAGTAAATGGAAAGGAMAALGTAMPWIGAGLLAGKAFGLFNNGGYVGPLAGIALKALEKEDKLNKSVSPKGLETVKSGGVLGLINMLNKVETPQGIDKSQQFPGGGILNIASALNK